MHDILETTCLALVLHGAFAEVTGFGHARFKRATWTLQTPGTVSQIDITSVSNIVIVLGRTTLERRELVSASFVRSVWNVRVRSYRLETRLSYTVVNI